MVQIVMLTLSSDRRRTPMSDPITLIASFKRRGAMKRDVGEGGTFMIEFPESESENADKAMKLTGTFYLTFVEKPDVDRESHRREEEENSPASDARQPGE
jgi:hypothetical protein